MHTRLFVVLLSIGLVVVAGALTLGRQQDRAGDSTAYVSEHSAEVPDVARTVAVSRSMPMPSAHARRLSAMLEDGQMPGGPIMAEVMTDTDCAPDAEMVSRCRNELRLDDGSRIVLRHPHDMSRVPCLAPGERVRLIPGV